MRELASFVLPIFLLLCVASCVGFIERIWLSRYSLIALEGSIQALYVLSIFQLPLINFANMAQAYIGKHLGAEDFREIGPCIWQMGWISLLSMVLTIPLGILASSIFFRGTIGEAYANIYFYTLIGINFFFPLGAALSSFYLAQGRNYFIICSTCIAYGLNLVLDLILVFGIPGLLPPLGILGAAIGMVMGRILFCGILMAYFLKHPNREKYQSAQWNIDFPKIWYYVRVGGPRAMGRVLTLLMWAVTSHFMVTKGGDYLLVLSIGGTVVLLYYFFTDSLIQALTLIFSRYLGANLHLEIRRSLRSGFLLVTAVNCGLSIPLLIFPDLILFFFFQELPLGPLLGYLRWTLYWIWVWFVITTFAGPFLALLLALKNTRFYMLVSSLSSISSALTVYCCINLLNWTPDKFWLILVGEQSIALFLYASRTYWLLRNQKQARIDA